MAIPFEDWCAITEVKARYCRFIDTKNWEGYASLFTQDVHFAGNPRGEPLHGIEAAVQMVSTSLSDAVTVHQVHNPEMNISDDGQAVDVIWAMQDRIGWSVEKASQIGVLGHTGYGHYHETYVKGADGQWRIASLRLHYLKLDFEKA